MNLVYCRLAVIFAREAPKAVIFRKGPAKWIQLILWHTDTDKFESGQWFHGKIVHNWSDLSPDGSKLIYYASKHYILETIDPEYGEAWTAISRPPYLTALVLWPRTGGGYFEDSHTVQIHTWGNPEPHRNHLPPPSLKLSSESAIWYGPNDPPLERNGWREDQRLVRVDELGYYDRSKYPVPGIWHKDWGEYRIILREFRHNGFDFILHHIPSGVEMHIDTDTWADWDHRGRLVYVNQGRILAGGVENGVVKPHIVADFNANKPERVISPDWARIWVD